MFEVTAVTHICIGMKGDRIDFRLRELRLSAYESSKKGWRDSVNQTS
jgi:hypothetical protein